MDREFDYTETTKREFYIWWFYNAQDNPYDDKSVYTCAYDTFIIAKELTPNDAKIKYPWMLNPEKCETSSMRTLTSRILEEADENTLLTMADLADC